MIGPSTGPASLKKLLCPDLPSAAVVGKTVVPGKTHHLLVYSYAWSTRDTVVVLLWATSEIE